MEVTVEQLERDPHPLLHALRAQAPVAWVPALGGWLVTRREPALRVLRDAGAFTVDDPRFSTARVIGPSMLSLDGPQHDRHREPFARRFRLQPVRSGLGPVVAAESARLVDRFAGDGSADLRRAFAGPLTAAIMTAVLGLRRDPAEVLGWYEAIVASVDSAVPERPVDAAGPAAFAELAEAIAPDLAGAGRLTRDEAVSNAAVLLFGGIETTEGMILNAVWHLLTHPRALAAVHAEPALLVGAVEESLRLEPAAARVDRYAVENVRIGDAAIARGDLVIVSVAAANRDPAAFPDPDTFDPRRPNAKSHLAFAAGPHVCLGMHLARLEAHTALHELLTRLPGLHLDPARPTAPRGLVFRKPPELPVRWTPTGAAPGAGRRPR